MIPILLLFAAADDALLRWMEGVAQKQLAARTEQIAAIRSVSDAEARKSRVRAKLIELIGGLPEDRADLRARTLGTLDRGRFLIEKVTFESLPGIVVSANLYLPKSPGPHPGILNPMGHWDQGKAAAQLVASNLAMKGFVVLVYDPSGQGERQQAYDSRVGRSIIGGSTEQHFLNGATSILLGQTFARYRIWDGIRALDYLVSRKEVDSTRIGCTGCSGGGTLATYLSALDPRIKVAAPACYMNSFRTLFSGSVGDSEQSLPGFLAAGLDQTDYVELFAPKPWLILSTEGDFFTPAGAKQVYEEARNWYEMFRAQDRVKWVVGPGPHGMPPVVREAIYEWMIRWLLAGKGEAQEEKIDLLPDHMLRVSVEGQVEARDLYEMIRLTPLKPKSDVTEFVKQLLSANPPSGLALTREPGLIRVQPSRAERPYAGNWLPNTRAWLIGHNLPAMHASQIAREANNENVTVRASGVAGVWALLAAVANENITRVELERTPYSYRAAIDRPVHRNLHDAVIPGFSLQWDLADLVEAIKPRQVVWKDPVDWLDNVVVLPGDYVYSASALN